MMNILVGILVKLSIGVALAGLSLVVVSFWVNPADWERYTEAERSNVFKSLVCFIIMSFFAPWTFG